MEPAIILSIISGKKCAASPSPVSVITNNYYLDLLQIRGFLRIFENTLQWQ